MSSVEIRKPKETENGVFEVTHGAVDDVDNCSFAEVFYCVLVTLSSGGWRQKIPRPAKIDSQ